jgi:hypothetical protein
MPWFDKVKKEEAARQLLEAIPPEMRDKTPEEIAAALKEHQELKNKVTTLETERAAERTAVATLNTQFNEVKQRMEAAELKARSNQNQNQNQNQEEPADFTLEPEKALNQRIAPLANLTVNSAFMTARLLCQQMLDNQDMASPQDNKTMDGRLFRAWEGEINELSKKYQPAQLTTPDAWLGIFYYVKGKHAHELANPTERKKKYGFLEPASQGAAPPPPDKKNGVEGLTEQEKHVADKMHVSYENYAKRKEKMQILPA